MKTIQLHTRILPCLLVFAHSLFAAGYEPVAQPANIGITPATLPRPVEVVGTPRMTKGHPCTLWDQEDIDAIKTQLKTNEELQKSFALLKAKGDETISKPPSLPVGDPKVKGNAGQAWNNASAVADLGILYVLTGNAAYGEYAKTILVAYAKAYPNMGHGPTFTIQKYLSAIDGRLSGQFLNDGFLLGRFAFGADLIYNLPSWTPEERKLVRDDLLEAIASEFYHPILGKKDYVNSIHNRAAICTSAILMAGYASDNEKLVKIALYGVDGTQEKPVGGVFGTYFTSKFILGDGLAEEGSPTYQLTITSAALMNVAETLWHHGMDMYRHDNQILKRLLDSAFGLPYPTPDLRVAAVGCSFHLALLDKRDWANKMFAMPFQYGYRRYRNPDYLPIIRYSGKSLSMTPDSGPPSLFLDLPATDQVPPQKVDNANYFAVGLGFLRVQARKGYNQVLLDFGPSTSKSVPGKLGLDIYALEDLFVPIPGIIFPYDDPMDAKWYNTSVSRNVLIVDEKDQITHSSLYKYKGCPEPETPQLVFGPATTLGIQRAWSKTLYPGDIPQDRALFVTADYIADLFGVTSASPHQYDLIWHLRGKLTSDLQLCPYLFPAPVSNGYNVITDVTQNKTDQPWSATITTPKGRPARFFSGGGAPTDVIVGGGHYFLESPKDEEHTPTLILRRAGQKAALFGSAIDVSGEATPFIKTVAQEGSIEAGYGLMKIKTRAGTDLCFAAYQPGTHQVGGLTTDAQQAFVRMDGAKVQALYLGGGKSLKCDGGTIERSEPGLAYVERLPNGNYMVGNPSPTDATVTVNVLALARMKAFHLNATEQRGEPAGAVSADGSLSVALKANKKVELTSNP